MLLALLRARDRTREELAAVGFTAEDLRRARGQLAGQGVDVHLGAASITIGPVPSTLRRRRRRPDRQPELFSAMTT